jgi:hypothetical protein
MTMRVLSTRVVPVNAYADVPGMEYVAVYGAAEPAR